MRVIEEEEFEGGTSSTKLPIVPLEPIEKNIDEI
jgi:hypothetical protein